MKKYNDIRKILAANIAYYAELQNKSRKEICAAVGIPLSTYNYKIDCSDKGNPFDIVQISEIARYLKTTVPALTAEPDMREGMVALSALQRLLRPAT
ncbi:MAG: hypothetical protein RSF13_09285 [Clostridiales bacterium]